VNSEDDKSLVQLNSTRSLSVYFLAQ